MLHVILLNGTFTPQHITRICAQMHIGTCVKQYMHYRKSMHYSDIRTAYMFYMAGNNTLLALLRHRVPLT